MNIRIGLAESPQILEIELSEDTEAKEIRKSVESSLDGKGKLLWLTDKKGTEYAISSDRITFVEMSSLAEDRKIGFGA